MAHRLLRRLLRPIARAWVAEVDAARSDRLADQTAGPLQFQYGSQRFTDQIGLRHSPQRLPHPARARRSSS